MDIILRNYGLSSIRTVGDKQWGGYRGAICAICGRCVQRELRWERESLRGDWNWNLIDPGKGLDSTGSFPSSDSSG
jgi:hypothetical protein